MANRLLRIYIAIRNPRYFLWLLCGYIVSSIYAHTHLGYDSDWGLTNLILSIEASTAGAVLMVVAEASAEMCDRMLRAILDLVTEIRASTAATLALAEAARDRDAQMLELMRAFKESDERLLKTLTGDKQ
jgi:hypothetical protein